MGRLDSFLTGVTADPALQTAALRGGLQMIGVMITGAVAVLTLWLNRRIDRRAQKALRDEQRADMQRALWSEILVLWKHFVQAGPAEARLDGLSARFDRESADQRYVPRPARDYGAILTDRLVSDVALLDQAEIGPVIAFYRQLRLLEGFAEEIRDPAYATMSRKARETMLRNLILMESRAQKLAEQSLTLFEERLDIPKPDRMQAFLQRLNNSAQGHIRHEQAPPQAPVAASEGGPA